MDETRFYFVQGLYDNPKFELINAPLLQPDDVHAGLSVGFGPEKSWPDGWHVLPRGPWRFPDMCATPVFRFNGKKPGRLPNLEHHHHKWLISPELKSLLEEAAPDSCDFRKCDVVMPNGNEGPKRWLCTVTRAFIDAIDLEKSENLKRYSWDIEARCGWQYSYFDTILHLKTTMIDGVHLFRLVEINWDPICDQFFKDACWSAGIRNLEFNQIDRPAKIKMQRYKRWLEAKGQPIPDILK